MHRRAVVDDRTNSLLSRSFFFRHPWPAQCLADNAARCSFRSHRNLALRFGFSFISIPSRASCLSSLCFLLIASERAAQCIRQMCGRHTLREQPGKQMERALGVSSVLHPLVVGHTSHAWPRRDCIDVSCTGLHEQTGRSGRRTGYSFPCVLSVSFFGTK